MELSNVRENGKLTIAISGRVDTSTAPQLEEYILTNAEGVSELVLDLKDMAYTSSAGLRVILKAQKLMNNQGSMKVVNVRSDVMEIFDITGFSDILTIE
ncbi:MAG: STAS domain-containing protein [Ruminococcaceae bacterium]|nr:STAS domain-containing protein [Oscillospiraceae bacterium]